MGNLFFISHSEEEKTEDDSKSYSNHHEANFLTELCKYLLNVGYEPKQITVLTMYTGQFFLLRKLFQEKQCNGVRDTPVDNYQGEENDIVLLSLVRSNKKNQIGFLSIQNRVCVALSRARKGLYIIGNGDLLRYANPLWRDILDTLKREGRLIDKLPLGCRKHPENVVEVACAVDFEKVPQYGCRYPCEYRLDCGHACERRCHELDPGHEAYTCMKPCPRKPELCRNDHICRKLCHEDCGKCPELVQRTLSRCQHTVSMACHEEEKHFKCKEPCKEECPVGHKCKDLCGEKCGVCTEPVKRMLVTCYHEVEIPCSLNEWLNTLIINYKESPSPYTLQSIIIYAEKSYLCQKPCKTLCRAGHPCPKRCHEACDTFCTVRTEKMLPTCGHKAEMACSEDLIKYIYKQKCKNRSLGHPCSKICGKQCGNCIVQVEKIFPKRRGNVECHQNPDDLICQKPCEKTLSCGHRCQELCGAAKCSQFCEVIVDVTLPCEHIVKLKCSENVNKCLCFAQVEVRTCEYGHTKMVDCYRKHEDIAECTTPVKVTCSTKLPDHDFTIPCDTLTNTSTPIIGCPNTCNAELDCGHRCLQKCRECAQTGEHSVCRSKCNKQFPLCLHMCNSRCGLPCGRCEQISVSSSTSCTHFASSGITICSRTSELCKEQCEWKCSHCKCTLTCSEPCVRPPCNCACRTQLRCNHDCVGLCGEPCPYLCRRCDRKAFENIEQQLFITLKPESRFVLLQPCSHIVEVTKMDDWAKRFVKHPPCNVDHSLSLQCPICKVRVNHCPRYNKVIKGVELMLNKAKRRLEESMLLKEKIVSSVEFWLRSNEYGLSIRDELLSNGKRVRLRLGSICILHEIDCMLQTFGKRNDLIKKYSPTLDMIGERMVTDTPSYCKSVFAVDVITLYRIYMEIKLLCLEKISGRPKLKIISRCKELFESLPDFHAATEAFQLREIWKVIEKVNKSTSTGFRRHERVDDIEDYVLYLNDFFDVELHVTYMSQWRCCSKGHLYSKEGSLERDMIDRRCPLCNPVHDFLLDNTHDMSLASGRDTAGSEADEKRQNHRTKHRVTEFSLRSENDAYKRDKRPSTVNSADVSNAEKKEQDCRSISLHSDRRRKYTMPDTFLRRESGRSPNNLDLAADATPQVANKKFVPFVGPHKVSMDRSRRERANGREGPVIRSVREQTQGFGGDMRHRRTLTAAWNTDIRVSGGSNFSSERERREPRIEVRSQSRDQFRTGEPDDSHFRHTNETRATKRSHRRARFCSSPDSDWSPNCKRRRQDESVEHQRSLFEAEMPDSSWCDRRRSSRDSGTDEVTGYEQSLITSRDSISTCMYRRHRTPLEESRVRWSHSGEHHHHHHHQPWAHRP